MRNRSIIILGLVIATFSCGDDDSDGGGNIIELPAEVELIFPFEDSECNEGTNVTETESTVLFEWQEADNTDEYELVLTDLITMSTGSVSTQDVKIPIVLQRATPYSWYVISRSTLTDSVAQSDTWRFYNAGDGIESYAPFPAEAVFPSMYSIITTTAGAIVLDWSTSDVDNDIAAYDVYFGTSNPPELREAGLLSDELTVSVSAGNVYYWSITTIDARGNQSESGTFQFKVE